MEKLNSILQAVGLEHLLPAFRDQAIDDSLLKKLTDEDLKELGVAKLGHRKKLLEAFAGGHAPVAAAAPAPRPADVPGHPLKATQEKPFINSLGVPFVPVPGTRTLFSAWPLRVADYRQFCAQTGAEFPACDFEQEPDHPVVNVTWNEAGLFCRWLSETEQARGVIPVTLRYRIPLDMEWSVAVCLPYEQGGTPLLRSGRAAGYPWGADFPPPPDAGNYHRLLGSDQFPETSPVGSFAPNRNGLYDLGGNVWEWCLDESEPGSGLRVLRGASCFNDDEEYLRSSYREKCPPNKRRNNNGIRLVLAKLLDKDPWY